MSSTSESSGHKMVAHRLLGRGPQRKRDGAGPGGPRAPMQGSLAHRGAPPAGHGGAETSSASSATGDLWAGADRSEGAVDAAYGGASAGRSALLARKLHPSAEVARARFDSGTYFLAKELGAREMGSEHEVELPEDSSTAEIASAAPPAPAAAAEAPPSAAAEGHVEGRGEDRGALYGSALQGRATLLEHHLHASSRGHQMFDSADHFKRLQALQQHRHPAAAMAGAAHGGGGGGRLQVDTGDGRHGPEGARRPSTPKTSPIGRDRAASGSRTGAPLTPKTSPVGRATAPSEVPRSPRLSPVQAQQPAEGPRDMVPGPGGDKVVAAMGADGRESLYGGALQGRKAVVQRKLAASTGRVAFDSGQFYMDESRRSTGAGGARVAEEGGLRSRGGGEGVGSDAAASSDAAGGGAGEDAASALYGGALQGRKTLVHRMLAGGRPEVPKRFDSGRFYMDEARRSYAQGGARVAEEGGLRPRDAEPGAVSDLWAAAAAAPDPSSGPSRQPTEPTPGPAGGRVAGPRGGRGDLRTQLLRGLAKPSQ